MNNKLKIFILGFITALIIDIYGADLLDIFFGALLSNNSESHCITLYEYH